MADLLAKKLCDGVTLTAVQDANYKTNRITCSFFLPLCTETASRYAISVSYTHLDVYKRQCLH